MEVDDYLNLQQAEGLIESSGSFTVLPEEALEKLSRYLLAGDAQALLKLMQGCVGLEAREIWIDVRGRELNLHVQHDAPEEVLANLRQLLQQLFSAYEDNPLHDLLMGIRHLIHHRPAYSALVRWRDSQIINCVIVSGNSPERLRRHPSRFTCGFSFHLMLPQSHRDLNLASPLWAPQCSFIPVPLNIQALAGYSAFNLPVENLLGYSALDCPLEFPQVLLEYHRAESSALHGIIAARWRGAATHQLGADLGWSQLSDGRKKLASQIRCIGEPAYAEKPECFADSSGRIVARCGGSLFLTSRSPSQERNVLTLYPVKRGVLLSTLTFVVRSPVASVVLPCDASPTDVSGLRIREGADSELLERALELLKHGLEIASQHQKLLPVDALTVRGSLAVGASVLLCVVAGQPFALGALALPGLLILPALAVWMEKKFAGPKQQSQLAEALKHDIAKLP